MSDEDPTMPITDAVDFYEKWPVLRKRAEMLVETRDMTPKDSELLKWMIRMVDMVGPHDITRQ
jgi:hypothetical protein